jgi:hypothetical protein
MSSHEEKKRQQMLRNHDARVLAEKEGKDWKQLSADEQRDYRTRVDLREKGA